MRRAILLALLIVGLSASLAAAGPYYNSSETGCGTDANVLMCEDFEHNNAGGTPGVWFINEGGSATAEDKGWFSTGGHAAVGPGAALCGSGVTPFGLCVGNGGAHTGPAGQGDNMAQHNFKTSTCGTNGFQNCGVDEIYVRWYISWASGYQWSGEKNMDPDDVFGIKYGNIHCNPGQGSRQTSCLYKWANDKATITSITDNGPLTLTAGRWYFAELHIKLNTPGVADGIMEFWTNDCGTVASFNCGASPVLRMRYTGLRWCWREPSNYCGIGADGAVHQLNTIWLENWANNGDGVGSLGTGPYWDQIKVSRVGPIGFSGAVAPPSAFGLPGGAGQGTYTTTGALVGLATPLPGPTLIGFVHRAALAVMIVALVLLVLGRRIHADR